MTLMYLTLSLNWMTKQVKLVLLYPSPVESLRQGLAKYFGECTVFGIIFVHM